MKFEDFKIGEKFFASAGFEWLCTDKGTRTITAIMLDPDKDESWFIGPPYLLNETVFDENDFSSCYTDTDTDDMLGQRIQSIETSSHPNFLSEDVFKMMKDKRSLQPYPRKNLLKLDRVNSKGEIVHPYTAHIENKIWYIKLFELFSREYSQMTENEFKELKISTELDMKSRKENFDKPHIT